MSHINDSKNIPIIKGIQYHIIRNVIINRNQLNISQIHISHDNKSSFGVQIQIIVRGNKVRPNIVLIAHKRSKKIPKKYILSFFNISIIFVVF